VKWVSLRVLSADGVRRDEAQSLVRLATPLAGSPQGGATFLVSSTVDMLR